MALLNPPLPERVKKLHVTAKDGTIWNDRTTLPYEPFIGTIGTSPEIEAISSLHTDYYGGNMDMPDVAPGAIICLPVQVPGGLLYLGACHATQGDGKLCGIALKHPTVTTVHSGESDQGLDHTLAEAGECRGSDDYRLGSSTQHRQGAARRRDHEGTRREHLFGDFIDEASRLMGEALMSKLDDPGKLARLYATTNK